MAFEFPFSLAPKTTAKAAEVMGNFNAVKTLFTAGLTAENMADLAVTTAKLAESAVTAAKVAAGAIGHAQLAAGYGEKATFGFIPVSIPNGSQVGAVGAFAHGLGVQPAHVEFLFSSGPNFAIVFEGRLIAWDAANITWQMIANTPMPGLFEGGCWWRASVNA